MSESEARRRLAVPLDVPSLGEARALVGALGGVPGWLKVGFELFAAAGPQALALAGESQRIFLDLKLHDIPNTVARAVAVATAQRVGMLTLHAAGGAVMLAAAGTPPQRGPRPPGASDPCWSRSRSSPAWTTPPSRRRACRAGWATRWPGWWIWPAR